MFNAEPCLFRSDFKYSCAHGWPSFSESVGQDLNIERRPDRSFGLNRTEVRCKIVSSLF
jgi:peptide methionine sulfoxide reductase MsrB